MSAEELARCVMQTLALPEIATLRPVLLAEFPVFAIRAKKDEEIVTAGIADALIVGPDGRPVVVVDWKSDVGPAPRLWIITGRRFAPISTWPAPSGVS